MTTSDLVRPPPLRLLDTPVFDGCALFGPVAYRPQSIVYRLGGRDGDTGFALKQFFEPNTAEPDIDTANWQFSDLCTTHAAMAHNDFFRVPKPIALFRDEAAVVMEWIDGDTVAMNLRSRRVARDDLLSYANLSGTWLRAFHEAGAKEVGPCDIFDLIRALGGVWDAAVKLGLGYAIDALADHLTMLGARPALRTWLHGDCNPSNIICSGARVYGIDISYMSTGLAATDVACFINYLRRIALSPAGVHLLPNYRALTRAFLAGYSVGDCRLDPAVLCWHRLLDDLKYLIRHYPTLSGIDRMQAALWRTGLRYHATTLHRLSKTSLFGSDD